MILKTYLRLCSADPESSLRTVQRLHGGEPHMRTRMGEWELIGIGDVLIVGGSPQSLAPIAGTQGPVVVDDLEEARSSLLATGAVIERDIADGPTGRYLYAVHRDGNVVEYAEWREELVDRWFREPKARGIHSAQL